MKRNQKVKKEERLKEINKKMVPKKINSKIMEEVKGKGRIKEEEKEGLKRAKEAIAGGEIEAARSRTNNRPPRKKLKKETMKWKLH